MQPILNLPDVFEEDSRRFQEEVDRFKRGDISFAQFRSFRVPLGVYEQRESDTYMLRVRFPAGGVLPDQMRCLASVARKYGNGVLHVTSRQDIQVHRVLVDDIPPAFEELFQAGLSTRGGGGNTVRNITGCFDAGVCADEVFDPTALAGALTAFLLPDPLSYQLPRKYKISFSGCASDCGGGTVNDVAFIAKRRNGSTGFAVHVGGGMGAVSRVGDLLEEFVPRDEVHYVAEAVKRVFDKHGNRKNRHKARLRFLMNKIGLDGFRKLYDGEMAELRETGLPGLEIAQPPACQRPVPEANGEPARGFDAWRQQVATVQRQSGYHMVDIPLFLGDVDADTIQKLATLVEQYGEGMARTTQWQNLVLRWVHENELAALHRDLDALGLTGTFERGGTQPAVLRNMVSCTGASTCKLGICLARGLTTAIRRALVDDGSDLNALGDLKINISGCPNACGRHPVGDVGFFGAIRRVKGRLVPHYVFQLGGRVGENRARLAQGNKSVPARNVPALMVDFLDAFRQSDQSGDFESFLASGGRQVADELVAKYKAVPDFHVDKNYYYDWGAEELFSLAGRGAGECGAGVFDLIEVDLASAQESLAAGRLFDATVLAARSLLVTRGQEAANEAQALDLFTEHLLDENLVDASLRGVVDRARRAADQPDPSEAFDVEADEVTRFVQTIQELYDNMDNSLRFKPVTLEPAAEAAPEAAPKADADAGPPPKIDKEVDFRGVVCPLNYVKTKMVLGGLKGGSVLSVLLDKAGATNVPESVEKDGHDVLSVEQTGDHWQVIVRKA